MRRTIIGLIMLLFMALSQLNFTTPQTAVPATRTYLISELEALSTALNAMIPNTNPERKKLYFKAREHYKHLEFFIEYFSAREAKYLINGALVPKHDQENGRTIVEPQGFQVIEEMLFGDEKLDSTEFSAEVKTLSTQIQLLHSYYESVEINDAQLLEMSQLHLHRIASMTLNGYDATYTLTNIKEADWSLKGLETVFIAFQPLAAHDANLEKFHGQLMKTLANARKMLRQNTDYNTFDRLSFITNGLNPLNNALVDFHNTSGIEWQDRKQALMLEDKNIFLGSALDKRYFSMYYHDTINLDLQAALGKLLFYDPILSGNNERSCASCHKSEMAFADQLKTSKTFDRVTMLERNAPGLLNVMYQRAFFHDGRVEQLEEQAMQVIHNKNEMGSSLEDCAKKLAQSEEYQTLFNQAFTTKQGNSISPYNIQKALAEYEKTLTSFNSRFDQFLEGNKTALNDRERNGYNIFAGKALCGSCHFFPLFNGTVPPFFADSEFEVIGAPETAENKALSKDIGRYKVTQLEAHRNSIKTPTVRNAAVTAPYMHNGTFTTLDQVVDFYHKGGGKGLGYKVDNQTLPFDSLQLSVREKQDIVLFMQSLTDTSNVGSAPLRLPQFGNAALDKRKVGGVY